MTACCVPACSKEAPPRGLFCPDCYFRIPRRYSRPVQGLQARIERTDDAETRRDLRASLAAAIRLAIAKMEPDGRDVA